MKRPIARVNEIQKVGASMYDTALSAPKSRIVSFGNSGARAGIQAVEREFREE